MVIVKLQLKFYRMENTRPFVYESVTIIIIIQSLKTLVGNIILNVASSVPYFIQSGIRIQNFRKSDPFVLPR